MVTYVLWGVKEGEYLEDLIAETTDLEELEKAKETAIAEGFTKLRVLKHVEGMRPDFTGTINI